MQHSTLLKPKGKKLNNPGTQTIPETEPEQNGNRAFDFLNYFLLESKKLGKRERIFRILERRPGDHSAHASVGNVCLLKASGNL